jgi:hypothetical protein
MCVTCAELCCAVLHSHCVHRVLQLKLILEVEDLPRFEFHACTCNRQFWPPLPTHQWGDAHAAGLAWKERQASPDAAPDDKPGPYQAPGGAVMLPDVYCCPLCLETRFHRPLHHQHNHRIMARQV